MNWRTLLVVALAVTGLGVLSWYDRRKPPRARSPWGVWPSDERDLARIARYARYREADANRDALDERTWTDLNLDDVFRVFDRAETLVGQQVLYDRLRGATRSAELDALESLVTRFEKDSNARAAAGLALRRMRRVDAADLWWLTRPGSFTSEPWHVVFPIIAAVMISAGLAAMFYPGAFLALAAVTIVAIALRTSAAAHLRVAGDAFRQVEPVLAAAATMRSIVSGVAAGAITAPLGADLDALGPLRRIAKWAGRDSTGAAAGELSSRCHEYLNLALSLDGNAVYFGARQLGAHGDALARVVHAVGEIDAALSIASYRSAVPGWSRPTFTPSGAVRFSGIRHPLLPDAVASTIDLAPPHGVIVTGSNMSGKTTFLRTLGVNVALAQTINTCTAERYQAPRLVVRTCIGRADDPASGKSYYLVEVEIGPRARLGVPRVSAPPVPLRRALSRHEHGRTHRRW